MDQYDVTGTATTVSSWPTVTQNCTDLHTDLAMKWVLLAANKAVQSEPFLTQKNKNNFFCVTERCRSAGACVSHCSILPLHTFTVLLLDMTD